MIRKAIRRQVQARAEGRCEYCRKPERFSTYHVDHIIALKHNGTDEIENLAWACMQCNICKGSDIASIDQTSGELTSLFNPRTQTWDDHFTFEKALIIGKTAIGRVTITTLQMNHPDQVEVRRLLMENKLWA